MTRIAGSTVLVTGAASGLGRRLTLGCARLGADLVAWDLDEAGLTRLRRDTERHAGRTPVTDVVDVSDPDRVRAAAERTLERGEPVDILVNNAGIVGGRALLDLPDEHIRRTFAVNTLALFWTTKAFLPGMVARDRGHVVTIASAAGWVATARQTDYAASKWAAVGFDESLRMELREAAPGVRTTVVCPYYIDTGMFEGVASRFPWLLPILEERRVATRIIDAIQRDRARLLLPPTVLLAPLARILPPRGFDAVVDALGLNHAMDRFVGRTGPDDLDDAARSA